MMKQCLNCRIEFVGTFCPRCGKHPLENVSRDTSDDDVLGAAIGVGIGSLLSDDSSPSLPDTSGDFTGGGGSFGGGGADGTF